MKLKKVFAVLAAVTMLATAAALPASAKSVSSAPASSAGGIHVEMALTSIPDYDVVTEYYTGYPGNYTTDTQHYYREISVPSGYYPETVIRSEVTDFSWGFPNGDAGTAKSQKHIYYTYKLVKI